MICCLNADRQNPQNPYTHKFCQSCRTPLVSLLRGHYRPVQLLSDQGEFGRTYLA
ncbi:MULTISPECIES: 4-Cys prefix domain-containing protein [Argonema]|uniref:4-Cys prefix domain-containing protein n=1 Tax=Argonema TaxID=2942761 RepID=UPI003084215D